MNKLSPKGINLLKDIKQNEYIINDEKFIIKYELHKRYELLIGNYNLENDKLEPEFLFKYESKESMSYHYEQLKKFSYKIFKVNHFSGDGKNLTLNNKDESNNKMVGRIFDLNNNNSKEKEKEKKEKTNINKHDINQNKDKYEEPKIVLEPNKKSHIEFLYRLQLYYDDLNNEINGKKTFKPQIEEGYIINYKLIETFKNFYYYNELKILFLKGETIGDIIELLSKEYITKVQKQDVNILKKEELYYPEVKRFKDVEMKYFINSTIIKKNLIICLGNDSHINDIFKHSKISYVIANKKVIILYGMMINIGIFDSNNIFNSEILIRCSGENSLNSTFNELR